MGRRGGPAWRDDAAGEIMAEQIGISDVSGVALAAEDAGGLVAAALASRGASPTAWRRHALGGAAATAAPPSGPFDVATIRLPKGREAQRMLLHLVAARLSPGGIAWLYGANDEGIKAADARAAEVFGEVTPIEARRHCRIYALAKPNPAARGALDDWREPCEALLRDGPLQWISFPGLFAHGRLDDGTALLISTLAPLAEGARVLDFACGAGVLGMVIQRRNPSVSLDQLDVDALALHAATLNVPNARSVLGDSLAAVAGERYDLIVSNPPFHAGVGADLTVMHSLLDDAADHLTSGGALRVVVQATMDVRPRLEGRYEAVRIVASTRAYKVWEASKPRRRLRADAAPASRGRASTRGRGRR